MYKSHISQTVSDIYKLIHKVLNSNTHHSSLNAFAYVLRKQRWCAHL